MGVGDKIRVFLWLEVVMAWIGVCESQDHGLQWLPAPGWVVRGRLIQGGTPITPGSRVELGNPQRAVAVWAESTRESQCKGDRLFQ